MGAFSQTAALAAGAIGKGAMTAWKNPYARASMIGAGVGGVYGGLSENGSVLGGALKGAALGAGGRAAYGAGMAGMGMYNLARGMGQGAGQAAFTALSGVGRGSAAFLGSTLSKAVNPIRGFFPRITPSG